MKKNSSQTKAQEANQASFRVYKKAKKMRNWVKKNGSPSKERDKTDVEEWLKSNEVKICPPLRPIISPLERGDPQWGYDTSDRLTYGASGCYWRVLRRRRG